MWNSRSQTSKEDAFLQGMDPTEENGSEMDLSEDGGSSVVSSIDLDFESFDYQMGFEQDIRNHYQWMGIDEEFSTALNGPIPGSNDVSGDYNGAPAAVGTSESSRIPDARSQGTDVLSQNAYAFGDQPGFHETHQFNNQPVRNIQDAHMARNSRDLGNYNTESTYGSGLNSAYPNGSYSAHHIKEEQTEEHLHDPYMDRSFDTADGSSSKVSLTSHEEAQKLLDAAQFGAPRELKILSLPSHEETMKILNHSNSPPLDYSVDLVDFPPRSRVETQIKCKLVIRNAFTGNAPPELLMHLPNDTIARPRFHLKNGDLFEYSEEVKAKTLWLSIDVINSCAPNERVLMCPKCLERERRRAFRKKSMDPHEEIYWTGAQPRRIVIFNCREVIPISEGGKVELPLRIACYCRHHAAKNGFQLVIALYNGNNKLLGRTLSATIFITDSHKDHRKQSASNYPTSESVETSENIDNPSGTSSVASPASNHGISIPTTPSSVDSFDSKSLNSVPEVDISSSSSHKHMRRTSSVSSVGMSQSSHPYARPPSRAINLPCTQLARQIQQSQSVPSWIADVHAPLEVANESSNQQMQYQSHHQQQKLNPNVYGKSLDFGSAQETSAANPGASHKPNKVPSILRVIPASGSVRGGTEVTLLGQNFQPGLVAMFGDSASISTQCWSESTIIAHVPPSNQPGAVPVTFGGENEETLNSPAAVFTYINDGEEKLKELALQMIGYKLTGNMEDANTIADRINKENANYGAHSHVNSNSIANGDSNANGNNINRADVNVHNSNHHVGGDAQVSSSQPTGELPDSAEHLALWILGNLHKIEPSRPANVNLRNKEGQSMVHIAALLGYASVVKALMSWNAYIDLQDVNGYTPLHFSVLFGNRNTTRILLMADADPFNRTLNGLTALDLADVTVEDLLPKDQRSWYNELNQRGSMASLDSMVSNWQNHIISGPEAGDVGLSEPAILTPDQSVNSSGSLYGDFENESSDEDREERNTEQALGSTVYSQDDLSVQSDNLSHSNAVIVAESTAGHMRTSPGNGPPFMLNVLHQDSYGNIRRPPSYSKLFPNKSEVQIVSSVLNQVPVFRRPSNKIRGTEGLRQRGNAVIEIEVENSEVDEAVENRSDASSLKRRQPRPAWMEKWASRDLEIRNDKMLFTFWIPLSFVTVLGLLIIYALQINESSDSHPHLSKLGEVLGRSCSSAIDRMMPLRRSTLQASHSV